ncbi:MAG: fatty acid hydroxylase [Ignavibacteria bacterium RIFOXYB2_FULL_35_12]|nr:MAG: fatty acid hydroxylase [Ignavibacteria bacterium GWA2_36_19]OGU51171.1 MAG: fatty acid hydroxylase [Ignavibacteria bacterium GWC2_35_8]OGU59730.1 MAG: fatty acid hydroxylase [Ignavibacteria bacterium GWF2_35_20]OGU80393.1 MAG: fatty acid hydroxylase [Ignavibacteria bacterium RBG_16_35_7]OGU85198.1 MAG: fatty acid hydroxylase [Ignavibacteria bacterium RIFOXYA12_FULL_35_25]OGU91791.1 MAG: fatty acid hydroxylase [Ignavibacteria bacterium RIFOXYC12_FULL_35_11]OGU97449.1 MAG: fatty acid hy
MPKNFVSNKDKTVRMFKSDLFEAISRVHFTVPLYIFLPIIFYFLYWSIWMFEVKFLSIISLIIIGLFVWTLTEYTLHRFIFHFQPKSKLGQRLHFIFHGVHHDYPSDSKRLVMPPSVSLPLAALLYFLFRTILGVSFVAPFFVGFLIGYLFYDMSHYAIHHFNMHGRIWLAIKNHHMKHHYQDPSKGFGVSTPLWDIIIGTNFLQNRNKKEVNPQEN